MSKFPATIHARHSPIYLIIPSQRQNFPSGFHWRSPPFPPTIPQMPEVIFKVVCWINNHLYFYLDCMGLVLNGGVPKDVPSLPTVGSRTRPCSTQKFKGPEIPDLYFWVDKPLPTLPSPQTPLLGRGAPPQKRRCGPAGPVGLSASGNAGG